MVYFDPIRGREMPLRGAGANAFSCQKALDENDTGWPPDSSYAQIQTLSCRSFFKSPPSQGIIRATRLLLISKISTSNAEPLGQIIYAMAVLL